MRRTCTVLSVSLAVAIAACRSGDPGPPAPTAGSAGATASAVASSGSSASGRSEASSGASTPSSATADPLAEKLRHCPVTVEGATTVLADVDGGIELVVTAKDEAGVREVRARVKHLEELTADKPTGVTHGAGSGGGWMRDCPVVSRHMLVVGSEVEGGSRIVVRPKGGASVAELRAETRRRQEALAKRPADGPG